MVVSGVIDVIPNEWNEPIMHGEKIFVYATELDEQFDGGLDFTNPLHQKVWNEIAFGNLPDEIYTTNAFIGYVKIGLTGSSVQYNLYESERLCFVNCPHLFDKPFRNANISLSELDVFKANPTRVKRMIHRGNVLTVPVGKDIWEHLKAGHYRYPLILWEQYMSKIIPPVGSLDFDNEITIVNFTHHFRKLSFDCSEACLDYRGYANDGGETMGFEVLSLDLGYPLSNDIPYEGTDADIKYRYNKQLITLENWVPNMDVEDNTMSEKHKFRNPRAVFISTPMGGQNKWKR